LIKADPSVKEAGLKRQMELVFERWPEEFAANYKEAPEYVRRGSEFLRNSNLWITAITGNREFDYQLLLDVVAERLGVPRVDYTSELFSCGEFVVYTAPSISNEDSTCILWLPYHPVANELFRLYSNDKIFRSLSKSQSERIAILTHENPCASRFGSDRAAKMQATLDDYIAGARKVSKNVTLFCGHLDISADPVEYNGIKVQPVSGSEAVLFNMATGEYSKQPVE
jgi:hypothetical protein